MCSKPREKENSTLFVGQVSYLQKFKLVNTDFIIRLEVIVLMETRKPLSLSTMIVELLELFYLYIYFFTYLLVLKE